MDDHIVSPPPAGAEVIIPVSLGLSLNQKDRGRCTAPVDVSIVSMVIILDGTSEMCAHLRSNICDLLKAFD